eukprot:8366831-Pyramimonas_sp.AAC.1
MSSRYAAISAPGVVGVEYWAAQDEVLNRIAQASMHCLAHHHRPAKQCLMSPCRRSKKIEIVPHSTQPWN